MCITAILAWMDTTTIARLINTMKIRTAFLLPFIGAFAALCLAAASPARALDITPSMIGFKQLGPSTFEVVTSWKIGEAPPKGYVVFTHITSPTPTDNGDILTQADSGLGSPDNWKAGSTLVSKAITVSLPAKVADGAYKYRVGMFSPTAGDRVELKGNDEDGDSRYVLAKVVVSGSGATITCPGMPVVTNAMENAGTVDAWPSIVNFQQTGAKTFTFQISYDVKSAVPAGYVTFVHLTSLDANPKFDVPSGPGDDVPSEQWPVGQKHVTPVVNVALPDTYPDGTYDIRIGMYAEKGDGARLKMVGTDDGTLRYIAGKIVVSGGGSKIVLEK